MKILKSRLFWATIAFGLALAISYAIAQTQTEPDKSVTPVVEDTAIQKPMCDLVLHPSQSKDDCYYHAPTLKVAQVKDEGTVRIGNSTPIRSNRKISEEALRQYLESKKSPLARYSHELLESNYWETIVAITGAEESFYIQPGASPYNLWGKMFPKCCILQTKGFENFPNAIKTMDAYLDNYWTQQRHITQIEGWSCAYVVPCSTRWENSVLNTRKELLLYETQSQN